MASHPLPAVLAFARVAHHASFTRAALELEVSPSALSQTVRALERQARRTSCSIAPPAGSR